MVLGCVGWAANSLALFMITALISSALPSSHRQTRPHDHASQHRQLQRELLDNARATTYGKKQHQIRWDVVVDDNSSSRIKTTCMKEHLTRRQLFGQINQSTQRRRQEGWLEGRLRQSCHLPRNEQPPLHLHFRSQLRHWTQGKHPEHEVRHREQQENNKGRVSDHRYIIKYIQRPQVSDFQSGDVCWRRLESVNSTIGLRLP